MSWNLEGLKTLFANQDSYAVAIEGDCLLITNSDGIESYMTVSGDQMIVETLLFSTDAIKDPHALNDEILRTHQIFPLTTIGINRINENDYYVAFGALSSASKEESVLVEVDYLFRNVEGMLDTYEEHIK